MGVLKSLIFGGLLLSVKLVSAQPGGVAAVQANWNHYQNNTLQEKLYVHTDKSTYVAGDLIWAKIYYVNAANHKPLHLSKVAYVEVLDRENKPVIQAKISLDGAGGRGSLFVPLGVATGHYKLRAYTAWMQNFGPEHFFEKPIVLINTLKNLEATKADTAAEYTVACFPEGGNLVQGLQSKVAVKVTGPDGAGVPFSGTLVTQSGDVVASVQALRFGIGTFLFTPAAGQPYSLVIKLPSGRLLKHELPPVYNEGYVMQLQKTATNQIQITAACAGRQTEDLFLFAHNRQQVQWAETKTLANGQTRFLVNAAKLPEGITHFTLFNEKQQPVCERLYFNKPNQPRLLEAHSDKAVYRSREQAEITVQAGKLPDTSAVFNLSLSVYRLDSIGSANSMNILNYLYLTSELQGKVEAPDYYFSDSATAEATDNLMLTHGWRRFRWETILSDRKPVFSIPLEYNGHLLKAVVSDVRTGQPAAAIAAFLSVPGHPFKFYVSSSDSTGKAQFDVKGHYGAGSLVFQTNTLYDSVYRVQAVSPFAQQYTTEVLPRFHFLHQNAPSLLRRSIGMQVQQIYNRDSLAVFRPPAVYDTVPFYGRSNYSYLLDAYTRFQTMEEVLREYVLPISVVQRRGGLYLQILDEARQQFFESDELVLLDGIPVFDKNKIFTYDPLKVRKLDVITKRYFLGPALFNGIASFTTYNGNYEGFALDPRSVVIDYEGLQLEREFYAPVYETEQQRQSRKPDFRNTLLWKPHVVLPASGTTTLGFYTSDQKGRYLTVVEGLDAAGHAVAASSVFEVN